MLYELVSVVESLTPKAIKVVCSKGIRISPDCTIYLALDKITQRVQELKGL